MKNKKLIAMFICVCMLLTSLAVFSVSAEDTTYTLIDKVDDLASGTYYMSGVVDTTYHVFTGSIGSGDLYTSAYSYVDGALSTTESYTAVAVEVAAVEGKANTYTLYVEGKGYISCTDASNNRKLAFADTAAEWVASANDNGGINLATTLNGATCYMGTNSAASTKLIRSYKESSKGSLTYGVVFFAEEVEEDTNDKTPANLTTDIGIMYSGVTGKYEGVTTLITTPGTYSFTWDKAAMFEQVEGNVYKVVQVVGGSQTAVNLTIADGQFIVSANAGNDWPSLTQGTGWWTGGSDNNGVPYDECPNFCTAHIGAWFATVSALEAGALYEVVGIDLANPVVDANYVVDFDADPTYSYTKADYVTYSYLTPASASSDEEEDAYKESLTYVDGVNVGTIQERGEQWDDKPVSDFWYGVVDYGEYVQITVAVDDRAIIEDDTKLRVWVDADPSDTDRTTLIDVKIKNGVAYASRVDGGYDDAFKVANVEYHDDVLFGVEFDKAALGIDGEYGLVVTLSETGRTTMHSIKYDNITGEGVTYAPWTTTAFYEIFGGSSEVDTTLTIEEAIALGESMEHNTYTDDKYYVTGVIESVYNTQYGNMYLVDDDGNRLTIYGTYSANGELRYDAMEVKPDKGDTVTIYGVIGQYNGTAQIKNGWVINHIPGEDGDEEETPDPEADSTLTIEEAIALGASKTHNVYTTNKYYVTGVITEIYNEEYGNMKITDDAGNILTVYGTYSADGEVRFDSMETKPVVGDVVTVYGVIGQYNTVPQMKNGWITAINPEVEGDESDTSGEGTTPDMGDASIAVVVVVMIVAMAGVVVVAYRRRRA